MPTATKEKESYREELADIHQEAQKLIDAGNFRAGGSCFFKAAELAKQHGKEEDMISAAKSAMGMFLKSSGEMKEIGFKAQAEADHTYAVSIAKLYRLEAPE